MDTENQTTLQQYLEKMMADAEKRGFQRGVQSTLSKLHSLSLEEFIPDDVNMKVTSLPEKRSVVAEQAEKQPAKQSKKIKKVEAPFGLKPDGTPRKRKWTKAAKAAMLANLAKGRAARAAKLKSKKVAASKKVVRRKKK